MNKHQLPDLAKITRPQAFGAQLGALPVKLDERGIAAYGEMKREAYMDATQLLAAIRAIVREELNGGGSEAGVGTHAPGFVAHDEGDAAEEGHEDAEEGHEVAP